MQDQADQADQADRTADDHPGADGGVAPARYQVYGRRRGRRLRTRRGNLMETLLPRLLIPGFSGPDAGSAVSVTDPADPGVPACWFGRAFSAYWLEVGFGNGEHLAALAAAHPEIGMIGCEPFLNGVSALLDHIDRQGLSNIRIVPDDARPLLDALPTASLGRCMVLFADPWPKNRHRDRRFIGPGNLPTLARVLADHAELRLASDDPTLIRWMFEHTWRHPDFCWLARHPGDWRQRPPDWPPTRYEAKAIAAGRRPVYLAFQRRKRAEGNVCSA